MSAHGKREKRKGQGKTGGKQTLLQQHEENVRERLKKNLKPKQIAKLICMKNLLLPKNTIIADWIAYHKKNKIIKTPPVTGPDMQTD
jgi:hypothetical protein